MKSQSSYTPSSDLHVIKDELHEKITKAKAVLNCIMHAIDHVREEVKTDNQTLYYGLWTVEDYLDEIKFLLNNK